MLYLSPLDSTLKDPPLLCGIQQKKRFEKVGFRSKPSRLALKPTFSKPVFSTEDLNLQDCSRPLFDGVVKDEPLDEDYDGLGLGDAPSTSAGNTVVLQSGEVRRRRGRPRKADKAAATMRKVPPLKISSELFL